jgi:transcriptional regulator with XRE-family HTH domain
MSGEGFNEYVRRVINQKGLKAVDVERNSGRTIDRSHVSKFLSGAETNPSAKAMVALAKGLKVNPHEVFVAVTGCPLSENASSGLDVLELLSLIERIAADPHLVEVLRGVVSLPEKGRVAFLNMLKLRRELNMVTGKKSGRKKKP